MFVRKLNIDENREPLTALHIQQIATQAASPGGVYRVRTQRVIKFGLHFYWMLKHPKRHHRDQFDT